MADNSTPPDSSLMPFDVGVIAGIKMTVDTGADVARQQIFFQFPPKVINESNSSLWEDHDLWSIQPLKIHHGSSGRKVTMEWEYIASDSTWDCEKVASNLRNLKSYYYTFERIYSPVVRLIYGKVTNETEAMFRMMDLNITYSKELISNNGIHPLHTTVQVTLELANTMRIGGKVSADPNNAALDSAAKTVGKAPDKQITDPLQECRTDWY